MTKANDIHESSDIVTSVGLGGGQARIGPYFTLILL
jgi:hypothetical protein